MPAGTAALDQPPSKGNKRRKVEARNSAPADDPLTGDDEGPACTACRRRKTRCSREQPCSQCTRLNLDCTYDEGRERSGLKAGAVESLNQRLSMLEHMFLGQGLLFEPLFRQVAGSDTTSITPVQDRAESLKRHYHALAASSGSPHNGNLHRSTNITTLPPKATTPRNPATPTSHVSVLPPIDVVNDLVELYFEKIHPWIPVLHPTSFREKLGRVHERLEVNTILQAITSVCFRLEERSGLSRAEKSEWALRCRNAVILAGMDRFSVVNLQAMIIVAFDMIASGRGPSSWSIVGSMTRTVEQLQLSVEDEEATCDHSGNAFMIRRMKFLHRSSSWVEVEERRRVFWCVFVMDRFCSVATGWNNSLTSADVCRRLPCEGALWQIGNPVTTPWFGIVDRPVPSRAVLTPSSERQGGSDEEVQAIGGFAFCIEATENLNLVTKFFLQQSIRLDDAQEVEMWLLKFKELDLRLVRWRIFLPLKWRNACALNQDGIMDPNLTLAHITHNTAVIQLHQAIAYPAPQWSDHHIKLPSVASAETCIAAAREISLIATQYLSQSSILTNPQFSLCIFIAGRVLLAHAQFRCLPLDSALDDLINSLNDIAQRWAGHTGGNSDLQQTIPYQFAKRLAEKKQVLLRGEQDDGRPAAKTLDIQKTVYTDHDEESRAENVGPIATAIQPDSSYLVDSYSQPELWPRDPANLSPNSISLAFPPLPAALENPYQFRACMSAPTVLHSIATPTTCGLQSQMTYGQDKISSFGLESHTELWDFTSGTEIQKQVGIVPASPTSTDCELEHED